LPLEVVPGVEINTLYKGRSPHPGYYMDLEDKNFKEMLKKQQNARINQTKEIIKLIKQYEKVSISFDDVKKLTVENGSLGRPHLAELSSHRV
jgi:predicted metal-dependent phosphoesterase TrpH